MERSVSPVIPEQLRTFLRTGKQSELDDHSLAEMINASAIKLTQTSVPAAIRFSRQLIARSKKLPDEIQLASWRALGRATLMGSQYEQSAKAYSHARRLAVADPMTQGRIDRTLIDVHMYLGNFEEAELCARVARRIFRRHRDASELAKLNVNLANLYHRQDRHLDAAKLYAAAREHFLCVGDQLSAARCGYNLANTYVQLFRFREAESLYEASYKTYREADYQLDALDARWGISWLHLLEGKYHDALRELHECAEGYKAHGRPLRVATCELDRAEVYLQLALYSEARIAAIRAEQLCKGLHLRYETAKASLFRACAAAALKNRREATQSLRRAERLFNAEENIGFRGAVELLKADLAQTSPQIRKALHKALTIFRKGQLPLWSAIADLRALQLDDLANDSIKRLKTNTPAHQMPHVYAAWQTALGDRAIQNGRRNTALSHWRQAASRLDEVRANLPPLGMRMSDEGTNGSSPHRRLVSELVQSDPEQSLLWAERGKTAGLWQPIQSIIPGDPARAQVEQSLQELAREVARLSTSLYTGGERSLAAEPTIKRLRTLQQQVRAELSRIEISPRAKSQSSHRLDHELLQDYYDASTYHPVIHWHLTDQDIITLIVENKSVRSVVIRGGRIFARQLLSKLSFMLESASLAATHGLPHDLAAERNLLSQAGEILWKPLGITSDRRKILMISEGELANLPWAALLYNSTPLLQRHQFVHCTSIRHWTRAFQASPLSSGVAVLVGKRDDLPAIGDELAVIRNLFPDASVQDPARREHFQSIGSKRILHYAGHAIANPENPFYSRLELEDGPYFAADLRLQQVEVDLVVLAACRAAEETAIPGDESTGFVRSLLEMGARNVIAGHWSVADTTTSQWMSAFYNRLANGDRYLDAVHAASKTIAERESSCYHWAAFSIFGAGT